MLFVVKSKGEKFHALFRFVAKMEKCRQKVR